VEGKEAQKTSGGGKKDFLQIELERTLYKGLSRGRTALSILFLTEGTPDVLGEVARSRSAPPFEALEAP